MRRTASPSGTTRRNSRPGRSSSVTPVSRSGHHGRLLESVERSLTTAIDRLAKPPSPPILAEAVRYAVFPPGNRVRPTLSVLVASACGESSLALASDFAAALEIMHCASLVHDDLPCFDDAAARR